MTVEASTHGLLQTSLHDIHVRAGARLVDFGGWSMPIQYRGILSEHEAVRTSVGVFDLSHMGRLALRGDHAHAAAQWFTTNDVSRLAPGRAQYSLFCGDDGRIIDDIITYNLGDNILLVVNASNRPKLLRWIAEHRKLAPRADLDDQTHETTMIGFQGPGSERLLQRLVTVELANLRYYAGLSTTVAGAPGLVARTGYTGEDGFEIIVSASDGPRVWAALLETVDGVTPTICGLGARDTLRLEAGMPLYGHEIDETRNPYEAGLGRVVKLDKGEFVGRDALAALAQRGPARRLVAFELVQAGVPRQAYRVFQNGAPIGEVTSGNVSPSTGRPIGMAYVPAAVADAGDAIAIEIRGRQAPAKLVSLPFYPHRTRRITNPSTLAS